MCVYGNRGVKLCSFSEVTENKNMSSVLNALIPRKHFINCCNSKCEFCMVVCMGNRCIY